MLREREKFPEFDQLLSAYWLRPETALWRALDIRAMRDFKVVSPSLDFGAGDGVFSFIRAGGQLDFGFDVFKTVSNLDKFFDNVDVYDNFTDITGDIVKAPPRYTFDAAFDHKDNLLKKAALLGVHQKFHIGDGNRALPFADGSFRSIFSNIVYWLDNPAQVFSEFFRILRPGGQVCVMLPDSNLPEFSFYNTLYVKTGDPRWEFLKYLDRNRLAGNIKQAKSAAEWESLFGDFHVIHHSMHLSRLVFQLWDIGVRPLFPVLLEMVRAIDTTTILTIKQHWMDTFKLFLEPFWGMDREGGENDYAFHCYILEK